MQINRSSGPIVMRAYIFIAGYCGLASIVALFTQRFIRGLAWMALLSATLSAIILQIIAYLHLGYFDAWADIAFVTSWLIALGCTIGIYLVGFLWKRVRNRSGTDRD